jgi:hypothetical protein
MAAQYDEFSSKKSYHKLDVHKTRKYKSSFKKNTRITITVFNFIFSNIIELNITCSILAAME